MPRKGYIQAESHIEHHRQSVRNTMRLKVLNGTFVPWNKGLTKETDSRLLDVVGIEA